MPIVAADLAQIEWRVAAFLSQDKVMIQEILDGVDAHAMNCTEVMELPLTPENRTDAKVTSFRLLYGGSPYAFYMDAKMPNFSQKKWDKVVENFYVKYSGLCKWQKENFALVNKQGFLVNPTGRILKFTRKQKKDGSFAYSWPEVCNYSCQSLATGDIVPLWMVMCARQLAKYPEAKFVIQVHDEIVWDVPHNLVDVVAETCYNNSIRLPEYIESFFGFKFNVPLSSDAKFGPSWGNLERWRKE